MVTTCFGEMLSSWDKPRSHSAPSQQRATLFAHGGHDLLLDKNCLLSSLLSLTRRRKKITNLRKVDSENKKTYKGKAMQKLLRRFHHHPPRGLEAGDFMDAPLRSAAESQFQVRHADPSAMLPATHASPPAHEIQGGLGALSTGHVAAEAREPSANFALDLGKKYVSGLESWQQHPHWGLTSATGLEDVLPRALGHRQCCEYLQGRRQHETRTRAQKLTGRSSDNTTGLRMT